MSDIDQTLEETPEADDASVSPGASHAPGEANGADASEAQDDGVHEQDGASEIEEDLGELVVLANQRDEYLALAQRTQADFENYRKRVARDAAAAHDRGVSGLVKELLPAIDNLDRALEAAAENDPLLEGVKLVRSELTAALARAGIESFRPEGEVFDPSLHEAVATAPHPAEGGQSGTVIEVYQDGYRLRESVIRPARVLVAA